MTRSLALVMFALFVNRGVGAYEINNHADMSETAALKSVLTTSGGASGKLFRLGLKPYAIDRGEQTFLLNSTMPWIHYCYGSVDPGSVPVGTIPPQPLGELQAQPGWGQGFGGGTELTIAQTFRYGACFEDSEQPDKRPFAHFYNPQDSGAALTIGPSPELGPSSLDWILKREPGRTQLTGNNHFTWMDARDYFFKALTFTGPGGQEAGAAYNTARRSEWALTFQSLGHVMHHLQDMGSPQHTRNDAHCNHTTVCLGLDQAPPLGGSIYRPSGYEIHFQRRFDVIRSLAATATTPILFGLPREFWNMNTDNALVTTNPTRYMSAQEGIAAYTSTNFTSVGKDFRFNWLPLPGGATFLPANGLPFPKPAGQLSDVNVSELFPPNTLDVVRTTLCGGTTANCKMQFMGTEVNPTARTSAISVFSKELLTPKDNIGLPTYGGSGVFSQNFFTYTDAAVKLVPKAVEYSAGLINYFFRGEMEISLPDEGVYGIVDHSVEKDKGVHGFRFIKMKVKNTTQDINSARGTIAQNMTNGQFFAVAKFRRNTCYTDNLSGQIGTVGQAPANAWNACRSPVEEIVVSSPEPNISGLVAGAPPTTMAFDFPNPIPIESTDLYVQIVFKGTLGEEVDAVAVTTKSISEPSFVTKLDSRDVIACGTAEANICRPVEDAGAATINFRPCDNTGYCFESALAGRTKLGLSRWFGFNTDVPRMKLVEWYGGRQFETPGAIEYADDPGSFRRIAVLGDSEMPERTLTWGTSDGTVSKTALKGDLPVVFGFYNASTAFFPTQDVLIPAMTRIALTQIKAQPDDSPPADLPRYSIVRGVVVGVYRERLDDPDALPVLLHSNEENFKVENWYDGVKHPRNTTVYERGPVLPMPIPQRIASIHFSRDPAFLLPPLTTQEMQLMSEDGEAYRMRPQPRFTRLNGPPESKHWTVQ